PAEDGAPRLKAVRPDPATVSGGRQVARALQSKSDTTQENAHDQVPVIRPVGHRGNGPGGADDGCRAGGAPRRFGLRRIERVGWLAIRRFGLGWVGRGPASFSTAGPGTGAVGWWRFA